MCAICAAIPAAAAAGAAVNAKEKNKPNPRPVKRITAGIIVLLIAASIIYHSQTYS